MWVKRPASGRPQLLGGQFTLDKKKFFHNSCLLVLFGLLFSFSLWADNWKLLGPDGGDARSLAYDPRNPDQVFLGTSTGSMFVSSDGGRSWSRFAHLGRGDDFVLDHIVIDPKNPDTMFVSAWSVEDQRSGNIFRSRDGGKTWASLPGMHERSVRALAMAASDSHILAAGTLDGVFRSKDGGDSWERISPASQAEIRNIESIAIDPKDPNVIYAGTWHLAWKTSDGGATWHHITKGMIDDSDVFSIIVDPANSSVLYASACSGIYKSTLAGELFQKIQGIPFSARRTRILKQDPADSNVVYAGTTQGLWKTVDAGKTWKQMSNSEVVVNDVLIDPRNSSRMLLATDRGGVMASADAGVSFVSSNHGYTHRYVTTILADKNEPGTILVGVANDREWGGVFSIRVGAQQWQQKSTGLGGRDVFALKQAANGALIAGTNRGIFILDRNGSAWRPVNNVRGEDPPPVAKGTRKKSPPTAAAAGLLREAKVNDIEVAPDRWLAATSVGLFVSADQGKSWNGGPVQERRDFVGVQSQKGLVAAATRMEILVSEDGGMSWQLAPLPQKLTSIRGVTVTPQTAILLVSREGAFRSSDAGKTWERMANGLPNEDLSSISYDESGGALLATSLSSGVIFESDDGGRTWRHGLDSGYPLRRIKQVQGRLVAATPFDGVIIQQ
ncbi:MAG TPA: transcriptional regulator [Terriglobales bacterium]|nr:transcriptional regulator [Terriglobales bacterium]